MDGYVHPDFGAVTEMLDRAVNRRAAKGRPDVPSGAAVAVYHHGALVVDAWTGARDQTGSPWSRDTMATSFSTTKGVVATVLHRLADRGLVDYDAPVATYWPEFARLGKEAITVRQLLCHTAGLHRIRGIATARSLLDWDHMVHLMEAQAPAWPPGTRPGYHAITFSWLVGEVIRRVTGTTVDAAVQSELVEPLGLDGMHIGAPASERQRVAQLVARPGGLERLERFILRRRTTRRGRGIAEALLVDGFVDLFMNGEVLDAEIPAANGTFTARSLARMYAAVATPESFDGPPLVSSATLAQATEIQTTERDAVVMFPMRWRLGYHMAGTSAGILPRGFGHFGFGGSGAWGDPDSGLAVAMVLNRVAGSPFGDTRFLRVGGAAMRCARRRDGRSDPGTG